MYYILINLHSYSGSGSIVSIRSEACIVCCCLPLCLTCCTMITLDACLTKMNVRMHFNSSFGHYTLIKSAPDGLPSGNYAHNNTNIFSRNNVRFSSSPSYCYNFIIFAYSDINWESCLLSTTLPKTLRQALPGLRHARMHLPLASIWTR